MKIIEKYKSISCEYMISIYDGTNSVFFESDNKREVTAIQQYFTGYWEIQETGSPLCCIKSVLCSEFDELIREINFEKKSRLFYDFQDGYIYTNELYYIVMRINMKAVVVFEKATHNILLLRKTAEIENIHLSQLIKEPLNTYRIAHGSILLHCSACAYHNKAIVFPAQKGGGKSTLLMGMLRLNCDYLGNDSLFIKKLNNRIVIQKNPHAIRLGGETIENNEILKTFFNNNINSDRCKMLDAPLILNGKYQIVIDALQSIYNRRCIGEDHLEVQYMVFPKLNLLGNNNVQELNEEEIKIRLLKCIEDRDHRLCWLPFYDENYLHNVEKATVNEIIAMINVNGYKLEYNGDLNTIGQMINEKILLTI